MKFQTSLWERVQLLQYLWRQDVYAQLYYDVKYPELGKKMEKILFFKKVLIPSSEQS